MVLIDTSAWIFALRKKPLILLKDRVFDLKRKGLTIPYTDILIASAAIKSKPKKTKSQKGPDRNSNHRKRAFNKNP